MWNIGHYTEACFTRKIKRQGYKNNTAYYGNKYEPKKKIKISN